jgi:hypothetical protein
VRALCRNPSILQIPDVNRGFAVQSDASKAGWGAVLMQRSVADPVSGPWRPVSFVSGKWTSVREAEACARSLELAGLRKAVVHWSYLLHNGRDICVFTDHKSLSQTIAPLPQDAPWLRHVVGDLLQYPLIVHYLPGSDNHVPDYLSRDGTHVVGEADLAVLLALDDPVPTS